MTTQPLDPSFEALLDYLASSRGFDFKGYKRSSLMRRVRRRMESVAVEAFEDYRDYLEVHPEEFALLFDSILINVTSFFRDMPAWEFLASAVLPGLLDAGGDRLIRTWSAGCATGEEAYTLAMVLAEHLGADAFGRRVKVYATDVDPDALAQARLARYDEAQLEAVPEALREKYFERVNGKFAFRPELRRCVIFGRHDLVQDAPISRLDLLVCRNVLMYLNAETQGRVLARFHYGLAETGFMFLGKAEMLLTHTNLFVPYELRHRLFSKVASVDLGEHLQALARVEGQGEAASGPTSQAGIRDAAFDSGPVARAVVDNTGRLLLASERAQALFGIAPSDLGRSIQELEISQRPADLRSLIGKAYVVGATVSTDEVARTLPDGTEEHFKVHVTPLPAHGGGWLGVAIYFDETSRAHKLEETLKKNRQELEAAYEELQSTNEELETTNEELQSANEELETTNEELQSANEELETMNEELQSSNAELQTVNDELHRRTDDYDRANRSLQLILATIPVGLAVVNQDFAVTLWNRRCWEFWGLRSEEVQGRSIMGLDIGLAVERLRAPIMAALSLEKAQTTNVLDATNRRGKSFKCGVTVTPFTGPKGTTIGAALLFEDLTEKEKPPEDDAG